MLSTIHADVLVVGMGPAGATCARLLADLGLHVIGIEREEFPRKKACGGCITDRALRLLGKEIEGAIERTYTRVELVGRRGETLSFASPSPLGYGVRREVFDHLLLAMAKRAGVEVRAPERAMGYTVRGGQVLLVTDRSRYVGKSLVGAAGAGGIVARTMGAGGRYMIAYEVRLPEETVPHERDCVRIFFGRVPDGYGWVFPKEGHVNAGIVTRRVKGREPRAMLERFLREDLGVRDRSTLEIKGGLIPRYAAKARLASDRVLLAGDSAGLADPFLAEGISYAVLSGSLAAPVLASALSRGDGDLGLYEQAVSAFLSGHFRSARWLCRSTTHLPALCFHLMKRKPEVPERLFELIRGNIAYGEFTRWLKRAVIGFH